MLNSLGRAWRRFLRAIEEEHADPPVPEPEPEPPPRVEPRTSRLRGADFRRPDPWDEDAHAVAIREMKNRTGEVRTYNGRQT